MLKKAHTPLLGSYTNSGVCTVSVSRSVAFKYQIMK